MSRAAVALVVVVVVVGVRVWIAWAGASACMAGAVLVIEITMAMTEAMMHGSSFTRSPTWPAYNKPGVVWVCVFINRPFTTPCHASCVRKRKKGGQIGHSAAAETRLVGS